MLEKTVGCNMLASPELIGRPKILGTGSVSIAACFRSEGPSVSSPVREGGEPQPTNSIEARRAGTNRGAPSALG